MNTTTNDFSSPIRQRHPDVWARRVVQWTVLAGAVLGLLLAAALPATGQTTTETTGTGDSVMIHVAGDVSIPAGERYGAVIVISGDLQLEADADTVVVVDGTADLQGVTIDTLVVVSGDAVLGAGTRVQGDVFLTDADLQQDAGATVEGTVNRDAGAAIGRGFWVFGLLLTMGWALLTLLGALVLAAVAPGFARRAGRTITADLGPSLLAGLVLWIVVPVVGVLAFAAVIGIPTALALWFVVLPAFASVGFLVSGVWLGERLVGGERPVGRPYLAAFLGTLILVLAGVVPFIGPLVVTVASFVGSGALALMVARAATSTPDAAVPTAPPPRVPAPR